MSKLYWIVHKPSIYWIIFAVGASSAVAVFSYSLPLPNGDDILYLKSTISQGLAAIFTLVFAITIFGAQMMRKFTAMDKMIDKWTKILMIIFAVGIILPLMQLSTDKDLLNLDFISTANLSIAIDLGIVTFCVLAVIPYLTRVNSIMKYEGGISKLREEASEAIDSNHRVTASTRINELAELGESAADDMLELEAINIVNILKSLGKEIVNLNIRRRNFTDVTYVIETVGEHIEQVVNVLGGDALFNTISGLQKIGLKCTDKNLEGATKEALDALREIAIRAASSKTTDKKLDKNRDITAEIVIYAMAGVKEIGIVAIDRDLSNDIVSSSSKGLFEIGNRVFRVSKKLGYFSLNEQIIISGVIKNLEEIADKAYEKNRNKFKNVYEGSLVYLWILGANSTHMTDYLFSWDEIPGNDNGRLIDFLKQDLDIAWIREPNIEKIDNDQTIKVSDEQKSLSLRLNDERTKVELKIDGDITYEFITKEKNGKLNIYSLNSPKEIASLFKTSDKHVMKEFGSEKIRNKAKEYIKEKCLQLESELKAFEGLYDV